MRFHCNCTCFQFISMCVCVCANEEAVALESIGAKFYGLLHTSRLLPKHGNCYRWFLWKRYPTRQNDSQRRHFKFHQPHNLKNILASIWGLRMDWKSPIGVSIHASRKKRELYHKLTLYRIKTFYEWQHPLFKQQGSVTELLLLVYHVSPHNFVWVSICKAVSLDIEWNNSINNTLNLI